MITTLSYCRKWGWLCLVFLINSSWIPPSYSDALVRYPRPMSSEDKRTDYPIQLLRMALAASDGHYRVAASELSMSQGRALLNLEHGQSVDVVWTMTSQQREFALRPVRIPIYKGLIGWRLLLIRKQDQQRYMALASVPELKAIAAIQGHDWPDTTILQANGYRVQRGTDYGGMFDMLVRGRGGYFPRSIAEIWQEQKVHSPKGLVVESSILLHYPTAFYYFVNVDNKQLAKDLETGLERLIVRGDYDRLFRSTFDSIIRRAELQQRRAIELHNPTLPVGTPLSRRELWEKPPRGLSIDVD